TRPPRIIIRLFGWYPRNLSAADFSLRARVGLLVSSLLWILRGQPLGNAPDDLTNELKRWPRALMYYSFCVMRTV
ncbi:hypothetical protein EXIGLDRAFT_729830, partial [Exidia glandulosa HHB12029]